MGIKYNIKSRFHVRERVSVWNAKLALKIQTVGILNLYLYVYF